MGNFKRGDRRGGRDRGGRSDRQMHHAVCSDCGRDCEVPFRPSSDKPVFCSECFGNKDGGDRDNNRRNERRSNDRFDSRDKPMFDAVCDECGDDCQLPFRPSSDKPVYCSACFEGVQNKRGGTGGGDQNKKQFEMLNNKLDIIMEILEHKMPAKLVSVVESKEDKPVKKELVKKAPVKKAAPKKAVPKKAVAKKPVKKAPAKKAAAKKPAKKAPAKKKVASKKKK